MAPYAVNAPNRTSYRARQSLPRLVPAVPFALSRPSPSARPITPEQSATEKGAVTRDTQRTQAVVETAAEQRRPSVQIPLTPDSKASGINNEGVDQPTPATSPADTRPELDEPLDTQDSSVAEPPAPTLVSSSATVVSGDILVNGNNPTATPPIHLSEKPTSQILDVGGSEAPLHQPLDPPQQHRPQSSFEGIVFGAAHDSPAMSSTPQELEPGSHVQRPSLGRQPLGFNPQFATPFQPGHSQHLSEQSASWLPPPFSIAPPDIIYAHGRNYHPTPFPGSVPYQTPFHGQMPRQGVSIATNGVSRTPRSHSQSPIKSQYDETRPGSDFSEEPRGVHYPSGSAMQPKLEESPFALASYLSAQFGNPEFSDFILQVHSDGPILFSALVHGIVVARSPAIASAIRRNIPAAFRAKDSRPLLDVFTRDKFVSPDSLTEALKILYGAPLLSIESFLYGVPPFHLDAEQGPSFGEARKRMSQAVSYAAAGDVLQIPIMQVRGIELVKSLLRWDTLDLALQFGLDADASSKSSQNGAISSQSLSTMLLHDVLDFVAYHFPPEFSLHSIAPELNHNPRLPNTVEFHALTHNPRLSKIRFGEAPPEEPNYVVRILSSILLSVPLHFLQQLFNHPTLANQIGWARVSEIMVDVVGERESRRKKALSSAIQRSNTGSPPKTLLDNLYWEERAESSNEHLSGYKLTKTRTADHV
ncbi:hypothetical protein CC78DRAFT_541280 [Lojkania enalia]|uniref:Uncharacterized protein n=1 Tax=Lojkania enalia TaxID=147567 RepID=A0A9P4KF84_9PLEO|nr:hypothetical protein CC78DRAFT_541280 [Didymosphaeria enalia]